MILKVTTRHAICAVLYLVENASGRIVTAQQISSARGIPATYLPRILGRLAKANIIRSHHGGRTKGYSVVRDPAEITLFDVLDLFEGWSDKECLMRPADPRCHCAARDRWRTIERCMFRPLKQVSIANLLEEAPEEG